MGAGTDRSQPYHRAANGTLPPMRAVLAEVPEALLEERRRSGIDRYDEMWEGVLYVAAAPRRRHQLLAAALIAALHEPAEEAGLNVEDGINVCNPARPFDDYRIPDLVVVEPDAPTVGDDFGATGGIVLAVEVRSPRDDAEAKLPFYAALGVSEVLLVDLADVARPAVRLLRLAGRSYHEVPTDPGGGVTTFGVRIRPRIDDETAGVSVARVGGRRYL